jgi:phospholipid transport system transporter-binding protein
MSEPSVVKLEGALTLETAAACLERALPAGDLVFDFTDVTRVDSSALALLLAWLRRVKARGDSVVGLRAPPESLLSLARLYGVEPLLPLTT